MSKIKTIRELVKRNSNGKKVLLLFVATNIVYVLMLTLTIPTVMNFSNGMKLLDIMPSGYSVEYVNRLLQALGTEGRNAYLFKQLPLDMIYPGLFAITYCLLVGYLLDKLGKLEGPLFYFCWIPVFSGLFDYGENVGIITMLSTYPNDSNLLIKVTSIFSVLKSSFTTGYFIVVLIITIKFAWTKLLAKNSLADNR